MAKNITKILVPIDGSKNSIRGLDRAITISQSTGAEITGLYVIHVPAAAAIHISPKDRKKEISFAESVIGGAQSKAKRANVGFTPKTDTGNPADKITKMANSGRYDLVVIGSRGRGAGKEMFMGSVSNHVLHKAKVPVMVVK